MTIDLKALRNRARLSQDDMASRLGISRPHVSRLETGTRDIDLELAERWAAECNYEIVAVDLRSQLDRTLSSLKPSDRELLERLADLMPLDPGYEVSLRALIDGWERVVHSGVGKGIVKAG